jgi:RNA polymerase sigma factor (sigma-70 family)
LPAGELVRLAAGGDRAAWERLVDRFGGLVWSVARAHRLSQADAADVAQTTWLQLVEHLDRLQKPDAVGAWLATTARRESLRVLRINARMPPSDQVPDAMDPGPPAGAALIAAERDEALWAAFAELPERCRLLLRLLMADDPPSYEEIGEILGMPIGSIGPTRIRCLARLRSEVGLVGITAARDDS